MGRLPRQVRIEFAGAIHHCAARGDRRDPIVALRKNHWRKRVIGRAIRRSTVVPLAWIAEALIMGDVKRTATLVRTDPDPASGPAWKPARKLLSEITKNVD